LFDSETDWNGGRERRSFGAKGAIGERCGAERRIERRNDFRSD
jgi:hypothetical protein